MKLSEFKPRQPSFKLYYASMLVTANFVFLYSAVTVSAISTSFIDHTFCRAPCSSLSSWSYRVSSLVPLHYDLIHSTSLFPLRHPQVGCEQYQTPCCEELCPSNLRSVWPHILQSVLAAGRYILQLPHFHGIASPASSCKVTDIKTPGA